MAEQTLAELLQQQAQLGQKIAEIQRTQRVDAMSKIKTTMAEFGISLQDLAGGARLYHTPTRTGGKSTGTAPPKYRNPATGDTWSGRGLKPRWLVAALATGKTITDFSIAAQANPPDAQSPAPAPATAKADPKATGPGEGAKKVEKTEAKK